MDFPHAPDDGRRFMGTVSTCHLVTDLVNEGRAVVWNWLKWNNIGGGGEQ